MARRRRTLLLATLALAAPLPAFGLSGEVQTAPEPAVADLGVSASLDSCGLLETQIVCQLSVSYATLPNATSYAASVTTPDGGVVDFGAVPAGGTSLTVPYAGNGNYGVRVTAYGTPAEPDAEPPVVATDTAPNLSQAPSEPRVIKRGVQSDTTTRHAPQTSSSEQGRGPVVSEPTCNQEPPATPEEQTTTTTEDTATATPQPNSAETAPAPEAGRVGADPTAAPQTGDPVDDEAQRQAQQAAAACPAP
jgi:hypothetical protein